jgi:hypothetical protein
MDYIYWVVSRDCNQRCAHCYNDSGPGAAGLTIDEALAVVDHLPDPAKVTVDHIMLSGGEPLVWPDLLLTTLHALHARFGPDTELMMQTNGDLLDEPMLRRLIDAHVNHISVASQDNYHKPISRQRRDLVRDLLVDHGFKDEPSSGWAPADRRRKTCNFWGATEDQWIGPLWPRGRAMRYGLSRATASDKFCSLWSGGRRFLDYDAPRGHGNEVSIQLSDLYPFCQMTCRPLGDLREQHLIDILDRCRENPVFQAINAGEPERMGESLGISAAHGESRTRELGNHCLWCDEFFETHATHLLHHKPTRTTRGLVDLTIAKSPRPPRPSVHAQD